MKITKLFLALAILLTTTGNIFASDPGEPGKADKPNKDIVQLAVETDILATLVAAVKAGELVETLQGDGPFTVFAPTNEAFSKLPQGTLDNLLKPENKDQLVAILTYHVVPGKVMSSDLSDGLTSTTVNGSEIAFKVNNSGVSVNQAKVVKADIQAENGVVHVIDQVILPPAK